MKIEGNKIIFFNVYNTLILTVSLCNRLVIPATFPRCSNFDELKGKLTLTENFVQGVSEGSDRK